MQQYIVGGSIRDVLLGLEPKDIDYVWTGATPDDMTTRGFVQVGADFPVFLDSKGDQHALARIERKVGTGYNGFECTFAPSITIEDDLMRRDLTINSMAVKIEDWDQYCITKDQSLVIDPFNGIQDLKYGYLTHTSAAFAEDPIRILRTARFAARYGFTISSDTLELMKNIAPELNHVSTERIWAEFAKGLMEKHPSKMMKALYVCASEVNILQPYLYFHEDVLDRCDASIPLECRFVLIGYDFRLDDYERLSIPNNCSRLNILYRQVKPLLWNYELLSNEDKIKLFTLTRSFNDDHTLELIFKIMSVHRCFNTNLVDMIKRDLQILKQLDLTELTKGIKNGKDIQDIIFKSRISVLEENCHK